MKKAEKIIKNAEIFSKAEYGKTLNKLSGWELNYSLSKALMDYIQNNWEKSCEKSKYNRRAYYFSAEFLMGRLINNNLLSVGMLNETEKLLLEKGVSLNNLETVEDSALGNGGLGRLAACFLDSASALNLSLDGYGIRYKYGLFKQKTVNGFQTETADDWTTFGDPWSIRKESESLTVKFKDFSVKAIPYDMPVISYNQKNIRTLRLWQSEPLEPFDFEMFNSQNFEKALKLKNKAEDISRVLYPNDTKPQGKILRFRQQYFFCSASLQDILKNFKANYGCEFSKLPKKITVQLNDTHPIVAIPEFIRLLNKEGLSFEESFEICKDIFNYTNHTVLPEALEKWEVDLIKKTVPEIYKVIVKINSNYKKDMQILNIPEKEIEQNAIIQNNTVQMVNIACYCSRFVNGVAEIHTKILKDRVLRFWYKINPEKFVNVTNGITQRRWLALCNPELTKLIKNLLGTDDFIKDLSLLKELEKYAQNKDVLNEFAKIKYANKLKLKEYVKLNDGYILNENTIFDVQIKRLHEYKRQLLNIFAILEIYFRIKEGSLVNFTPTTYIFAAKAAPGYKRAKGIIKLINEVAKLIENDIEVNKYIKVVFLSNYNVSYAEKIIPAADVSEQISTAGTEASGTGNMKLMLNGAVTLGTYDGANIEIVNKAGLNNNYIFGNTVEEIEKVKETYNPVEIYQSNYSVKRVLDSLVNGTLSDGGTGYFSELYNSILYGESWHKADNYYLLLDFEDYINAKIEINNDYKDKFLFLKKCWLNMCNAGSFSSDRALKEYAKKIWGIKH